jgi:hypothetical protein
MANRIDSLNRLGDRLRIPDVALAKLYMVANTFEPD